MRCSREVEDAVDVAKNYAHADRTSAALYTMNVCRRNDLGVRCQHLDLDVFRRIRDVPLLQLGESFCRMRRPVGEDLVNWPQSS